MKDIRSFHPGIGYRLVCAGVPCQPFSDSGARQGLNTSDGRLYEHVIRCGKETRAEGIVLENVRGLVTWEKGRALQQILWDLSRAGYVPEYRVLDLSKFGIPQRRKRLIIVAFRDGRGSFQWPAECPSVSVRHALKLGCEEYKKGLMPQAKSSASAQGQRIIDVDKPAWTINATNNQEWIWRVGGSPRRLTYHEAAILQGFPDWFVWHGNADEIHRQVGNAVPPKLGFLLGLAIRHRWGIS
jgi:DNA (cytosine-5)-methyltransferase 1